MGRKSGLSDSTEQADTPAPHQQCAQKTGRTMQQQANGNNEPTHTNTHVESLKTQSQHTVSRGHSTHTLAAAQGSHGPTSRSETREDEERIESVNKLSHAWVFKFAFVIQRTTRAIYRKQICKACLCTPFGKSQVRPLGFTVQLSVLKAASLP